METGTARAHLMGRVASRSRAPVGPRRTSRSEQKVVIGAPLDEVIATFTSELGQNDRLTCRDVSSTDPAYRCTDIVLGHRLGVRYTFYAIPGGTQVVVAVEHPSNPLAHPRLVRAVRRERHRIAGDLASVKDRLE